MEKMAGENSGAAHFQCSYADPVSIHVLAMSAHEVLSAINKSRAGKPTVLRNLNSIRPEYHQAVTELFVSDYQFFKHGPKDTHQTTWFAPEANQWVLLDAIETYCRRAGEITPSFRPLQFYLSVHHPTYSNGLPKNSLHSDSTRPTPLTYALCQRVNSFLKSCLLHSAWASTKKLDESISKPLCRLRTLRGPACLAYC
jgi:hypothetical protein